LISKLNEELSQVATVQQTSIVPEEAGALGCPRRRESADLPYPPVCSPGLIRRPDISVQAIA
jgi:hypothetical protein